MERAHIVGIKVRSEMVQNLFVELLIDSRQEVGGSSIGEGGN